MKRVLSLILSVVMVVSVFTFGAVSVSAETSTLIARDAEWQYYTILGEEINLPEGWNTPGVDTTGWLTGKAPFSGYAYANENANTMLADEGQHITNVFVNKFNVADADAYSVLYMNFRYDQDPVVYINGTQVYTASYWNNDPAKIDLTNYLGLLKNGENTVAVYMHNPVGGGGYHMDLELLADAPDAVDADGNVYLTDATKTGFADFGGVNAATNILDGNVGSCSGSGRDKGVEQSWTVYMAGNIAVEEIYLQTKGKEDGASTSNEDGITFGYYNVYVGNTLVAENAPAISQADGGHTVKLDTPVVGNTVKVELTGDWLAGNWANLADISVKGSVAANQSYALTDRAYFVSGIGNVYTCLNDGVASNAGYADLGSWADAVTDPAFGTDGACFMEVDLRALCSIETIWTANYLIDSRIYRWDAYVTDDNTKPISQWTKVGGKTTDEGSTADGYTVTLDEAVEGRYVRLYGMYNSDNTGFHFTEITVTGSYVNPTKKLADIKADFGISPYGGAYKGFENWDSGLGYGAQTQLLVCYSGLPETYADNTWRLTIVSDSEIKVVEAKPATSYDNWLHRFELAIEEGENQFVPEKGTRYSITAEVLDENGYVLHTSRTYHAFKCLDDPILSIAYEGYQLGTDGSSIRFIGSVNSTEFESVDLMITVKRSDKSFSVPTTSVFKTLNSVDGVAATVTDSGVDAPLTIDAQYLYGYAITDIPAGTYIFEIVPYATTASGSYMVGQTATVTVTIG